MKRIIGIPADGTELSDNISPHFGHCRYFIGVELLDNEKIKKTFSITNEGHAGCMEPVMNMKQRNVTDMILTGIGMRPFMGFQQVQINLFQGVEGTIEQNVKMLLDGKLTMLNNAICATHSNHTHAQ
ncbi:MAG: NifB/NifX family molybdenum-iron cluster-binding protein [Candidatus Heimdallarchaeota archaeon]